MSNPTFYLPYKDINNLTVKPTDGEQNLLSFLHSFLDETFEVIFQPKLNGLNPDIAIIHKGGGILIIEVKDWNLSNYTCISQDQWNVKKSKL